MQSVVDEQNGFRGRRFTRVADELQGVSECGRRAIGERHRKLAFAHRVTRGVLVAVAGQRSSLVEELAGECDDLRAALGIVAAGLVAAIRFGNHVRAIQGIVKTSPAGVGGVDRVAGIGYGNDELRPGDQSDLGVHIRSRSGEVRTFRQEVADLTEKLLVGRSIVLHTSVVLMPAVNLRLQVIAFGEQRADTRREVSGDFFQRSPDRFRGKARAGADVLSEEIVEGRGDLEAAL